MILRVAVVAVLLDLFIQYIEGVIVTNESDVHDDYVFCCIYGNCSCPSLHSALAHLTSNVLINLHFMSCYNCTIEGIIWERCGSRNISGTYNEENSYASCSSIV